jgi:DNA invertase Pin-like site-specific DNA recombinase
MNRLAFGVYHSAGYARVSSVGQKLDIQIEKLKHYGCQRLFMEKQSGLDQARPQLKACLDYLREEDTLVITRLDRLARSAIHLGTLVDSFQKDSIDLVVLDQYN